MLSLDKKMMVTGANVNIEGYVEFIDMKYLKNRAFARVLCIIGKRPNDLAENMACSEMLFIIYNTVTG